MQSQIAGLQWKPGFFGRQRLLRRRATPFPTTGGARRSKRYIDDPIDGATPEGLIDGLARLQRGELLSRASTERHARRSCRRPGPGRSG